MEMSEQSTGLKNKNPFNNTLKKKRAFILNKKMTPTPSSSEKLDVIVKDM
jgi:hypothetical protein